MKRFKVSTAVLLILTIFSSCTDRPVITALKYIEKSNELLELNAWDNTAGGYYNVMQCDWSVSDSNKSFSSQVTPVSGYLIYLYQVTREQKYLDQINRVLLLL